MEQAVEGHSSLPIIAVQALSVRTQVCPMSTKVEEYLRGVVGVRVQSSTWMSRTRGYKFMKRKNGSYSYPQAAGNIRYIYMWLHDSR